MNLKSQNNPYFIASSRGSTDMKIQILVKAPVHEKLF